MISASQFYGFGQDTIVSDKIERAVAEIYAQYGHVVKVNRKSLRKYGRNTAVGTGEFDITPFTVGAYTTETYLSTNAIDSLSSGNAGDTNVPVYIEGMTRSGDELTFVSQTANTDASNGQTRVPLTIPLCDCTRGRALAQGDIWIYENAALTAGKPTDVTKIHNQVVTGDHTSLKAGTSIARNNYFILLSYWATIGKASGSAACDMRVKVATLGDSIFGDSFFTGEVWSISQGSPPLGPPVDYEIFKPNSRIVMTGSASAGTLDVQAGFIGLFADVIMKTENGILVPFS